MTPPPDLASDDPPYTLVEPSGPALPLVFDSPHSGTIYPDDFRPSCPLPPLRQAEDAHVDALFAAAPVHGASLLSARIARAYIDLNRAEDDIDPALLDGDWPGPLAPSEKARLGMGLLRRVCRPGLPVYARRLPVAEVEARIARVWRPYHGALDALLERRRRSFGQVWLVDCHSMPSPEAVARAAGIDGAQAPWVRAWAAKADMVLGDRDGSSCESGFTRAAAAALRARGYMVRINDPYKGAEIVRRHGRPAAGRHALQLEIDRRLYMDETTLALRPGFDRLRADLGYLVRALAQHVAGACSLSVGAGVAAE